MSIHMLFYKILTCQKIIIKRYCVYGRVRKRKTINTLDVKLVKNSDIIKLANFNTAESNILTDKYVR